MAKSSGNKRELAVLANPVSAELAEGLEQMEWEFVDLCDDSLEFEEAG